MRAAIFICENTNVGNIVNNNIHADLVKTDVIKTKTQINKIEEILNNVIKTLDNRLLMIKLKDDLYLRDRRRDKRLYDNETKI